MKKIAIGCDHGGYSLKTEIVPYLEEKGYILTDVGSYSPAAVDYTDIAPKVAELVQSGECELGILLCGTGIGMSILANKYKGIRAAVCTEAFCAEMTRKHNDANIICMGGRVIAPEIAKELCDIFLTTEFEGGRHERRVNAIKAVEDNNFKALKGE